MMCLIAYRVRQITPMQHDWLRCLGDIVEKYFVYVLIYESSVAVSNNSDVVVL